MLVHAYNLKAFRPYQLLQPKKGVMTPLTESLFTTQRGGDKYLTVVVVAPHPSFVFSNAHGPGCELLSGVRINKVAYASVCRNHLSHHHYHIYGGRTPPYSVHTLNTVAVTLAPEPAIAQRYPSEFYNWCRPLRVWEARRHSAAERIQTLWMRCISDPRHSVCRKRLLHEFDGLSTLAQQSVMYTKSVALEVVLSTSMSFNIPLTTALLSLGRADSFLRAAVVSRATSFTMLRRNRNRMVHNFLLCCGSTQWMSLRKTCSVSASARVGALGTNLSRQVCLVPPLHPMY